jgi:hypothetical protein
VNRNNDGNLIKRYSFKLFAEWQVSRILAVVVSKVLSLHINSYLDEGKLTEGGRAETGK